MLPMASRDFRSKVLLPLYATVAFCLLSGVTFTGCGAGDEATASADQSRKEASEKGGVLSHLTLPSPKLTIPGGTPLSIRLLQSISSRSARADDQFEAELAAPVQVDGRVAFPRGSRVRGLVVDARASGRLENPGFLQLTLTAIQDTNGKWFDIHTSSVAAKGKSHKKRNATLIAGGAGLGAIIGGIAGGGKGAAIGAASGVGAGTAGAYDTGKKDVTFFAEQKITFATTEELTMKR